MDYEMARAIKTALEAMIQSLNTPMRIAADLDNSKLRQMVGSLASDVIAKIDFEILPYLYAQYPELKTE
jgi:hypothetical protein